MKDSKYYIQQRQEGKDVLSWIENFGLHLINDKSERCLTFGEQDHVLVLHIKNKEKEDTINAYYSYFSTSNKGKTRFCINAPFDGIEVTTNKLWELMEEKADWSSSETRRWWECVFPKGQFVDETTLQRVAVKDSSDMKMSEFVSSISAVFEKVIAKLGVDKDKFTKVCIVGHYAMALPVLYALRKMFKEKYVAPYVFTKNVQMKDNPWQQNSHCFLTPKKLCDTIIKSTPQMTIGDVLFLREKGITFTLPLSKGESGEYCLPTTPVIDNSELKWNDLMTENIQPDYTVDNLAFKRVHLSVFADGFQNVYMNCGESLVCLSYNHNGIIVKNEPVPRDEPKVAITDSTDPANPIKKPVEPQTTPSPYDGVDEDIEQKMLNIKHIIDDALEFTTRFLEKVANNFFREKYPNEEWTQKYGESLRPGYMTEKWQENSQIEFSNFACFLSHYRNNIIGNKDNPGVNWRKNYSSVVHIVGKLKPIRNTKSHGYSDIVGIGLRNLNSCLNDMEDLARVFDNQQLKEKMSNYYNELQSNFDKRMEEYWKSDAELQRVYMKFEAKKNK